MYTRYFRKKNPTSEGTAVEWIEMSGKEYYQFITDPQNKNRHFIDLGDVVLETTAAGLRDYKTEQNHHYYIQTQEYGWSTVSIYAVEDANGCSGEEVVVDENHDVEAEAIMRIDRKALRTALSYLDAASRQIVYALYFAEDRKSERELARDLGCSQNAVNKRKRKILKTLKFLVVKIQKSQQ